MTSTAHLPASPTPDTSFYRRLRMLTRHVLIELDPSLAPLQSFSSDLIEGGWSGILLEQNQKYLTHLKDYWKIQSEIQCLYWETQALQSGDSHSPSIVRILSEYNVPTDFGVLIVNAPAGQDHLFEDLKYSSYRPVVVALRDEFEPAERRYPGYERLAAIGYRFCSVEQDYSLWTLSASTDQTERVSGVPAPGVPEEGVGSACFDKPTSEAIFTAAGHIDLNVGGWAFLPDSAQAVPPRVYLEVEDLRTGEREYIPASRYRRPDVVWHYNRPELLMSGFVAEVPMRRTYSNGFRLSVVQCDGLRCYSSSTKLTVDRGLQNFEQTVRQDLARKFLRGSGIEIGALQRKLQLPATCHVRYVDRMRLPDLLHHYPELKDMPLQPPDIVDDGECLHNFAANSLDFVIANHFFEHCVNPIQTLLNVLRVLKQGGILFMAVPDKRFTFDARRPSTCFQVLLETYRTGARANRADLYREWVQYVEMDQSANQEKRTVELMQSNYSIHFNVWSADELFLFMMQARQACGVPFEITSAVCSDNETILLLEHTA